MSEKISLSIYNVMNSQAAKIDGTFNKFNFDEHKSYLKLCKQNSEVNFKNKKLKIFNSSKKMGKSMLLVS